MSNAWPVTLPPNVLQGVKETTEDNVIKSKVDVGPQKRRLRSSAITRTFDVEVKVNRDQYLVFQEFYEDTLNFGVDKFDWVNPSTGDASTNCYIEEPNYDWFTPINCSIRFKLFIRPY